MLVTSIFCLSYNVFRMPSFSMLLKLRLYGKSLNVEVCLRKDRDIMAEGENTSHEQKMLFFRVC